jgi:hypothetical protein
MGARGSAARPGPDAAAQDHLGSEHARGIGDG